MPILTSLELFRTNTGKLHAIANHMLDQSRKCLTAEQRERLLGVFLAVFTVLAAIEQELKPKPKLVKPARKEPEQLVFDFMKEHRN